MQTHPHGSMYKCVPSKDSTNSVDLEDDSELLQDGMVQESTDPPSRLTLPHVLVASIVSFLFGYHLGALGLLVRFCSVLGFFEFLCSRNPMSILLQSREGIYCIACYDWYTSR